MEMERKLRNAAIEGDVKSLLELLQHDELILDRYMVSYSTETPLHISAMLGHLEFTKEILRLKPQLVEELNSQRCTPLHLASAKGYVEIVKELLSVSPDKCLVREQDGLIPLHMACIRGRVLVMKELLRARPDTVRVLVDQKDTILHLCVKHNQVDALKVLVESIGHEDAFLNSKDEYGNSILHLAVADKRIEMIKYLITSKIVKVNESNMNGLTSMDILAQSRRDVKDMEIGESLRSVGALKAKDLHQLAHEIGSSRPAGNTNHQTTTNPASLQRQEIILEEFTKRQRDWIKKQRDALMVVATLIATMAYQVIGNPPGGFRQENGNGHDAGEPIFLTTNPLTYNFVIICSTLGFFGSVISILLLSSGLPIKSKLAAWLLMVIMRISILAMALAYFMSALSVSPNWNSSLVYILSSGAFQNLSSWALVLLMGFAVSALFIWLTMRKWFRRFTVQRPSTSIDTNTTDV